MLRSFLSIMIVLMALLSVSGQASNFRITEDPAVNSLVEQFIIKNKATPYVEGWRVQILSTTDRDKLESVRGAFKSQYPYLPATWVHNRPYYMLRAGAFTNKLDALRLQQFLRGNYPSAYPVQDDKIEPSELLGYY